MSSKANTAPRVSTPADLRNVVLIGSAGSGKSTLFDNLLAARIPGYRATNQDTERAAALTLTSVVNHNDTAGGDIVINLLDAPGHPDYAGELRAGLRAADGAVFVVSAADGIDPITTLLWRECEAVDMPRAIVITKLDTPEADFESTLDLVTKTFGAGTHPAYLPLEDASGAVVGNLSLLTGHVHDYSSGTRVTRPATEDERSAIEAFRADYVEGIITESEDDDLLERYFNGDELDTDHVVEDLFRAIYHGSFHPVLPVMMNGVGVEELYGLIHRGFPVPNRHVLPLVTDLAGNRVDAELGDPQGPLIAQVIRTISDPYAGRLSLARIFSGTLQADDVVHVAGHAVALTGTSRPHHLDHDEEERVGPLSVTVGLGSAGKQRAIAGEIVYIAKLSHTQTGDTLSSVGSPRVVAPWPLPQALLPVAIRARNRTDEDRLASALQRLVLEDATVRLARDPDTDQLLVWTTGQAHQDLLLNRLRDRYGVEIETEEVRTPLRETFIAPGQGHGRHVKQSGGHGQYAVCDIRVDPGERGSGVVFVDEVVGGAVPRQYIASVEKGVRAQASRGTITGHPLVDITVTLHDGKSHPVDSSDMAFQSAGAIALRDAANESTVSVLEPVDEVTVSCAEDHLGAVLTDLTTRRGQVTGQESLDGEVRIHALVPASELVRYAIDLRGLSHGTGSFERSPHGYQLLPDELARTQLAGRAAGQH